MIQLGFDLAHVNSDWLTNLTLFGEATARKYAIGKDVMWATTATLSSWKHGRTELSRVEVSGDLVLVLDCGEALVAVRAGRGRMSGRVLAKTTKACEQIIAELRTAFPMTPPRNAVPVNFWFLSKNGPTYVNRLIDVPTWDEIADNYGGRTRPALERLMQWRPSTHGQLILWSGSPGTGKTWAIRALAREWKQWCSVQYITDPDNFFGKAVDYLMHVATVDDDDDIPLPPGRDGSERAEKWRLLILEDAGELLTLDAKDRVGQGLGRLLNLVDGLLGQGQRLLVLITTNEDIEKMHPAVIRSGRCAARIEFGMLTEEEVWAWSKKHGGVELASKAVLADLYARSGQVVAEEESAPVGFRG